MKGLKNVITALLAGALIVTGIPVDVAANVDTMEEILLTDDISSEEEILDSGTYTDIMSESVDIADIPEGYSLKWADEFNGNSLNRDNWNVELHEKGWVNSELQEYVDSSDNIKVEGGFLKLIPKKEEINEAKAPNLLTNGDFSNGTEGWITSEGWDSSPEFTKRVEANKMIFDIVKAGNANWVVQMKQGFPVVASKKYKVSFNVKSTIARKIESGVLNEGNDWFGGTTQLVNAGEDTEISYEFTPNTSDATTAFSISMGQQSSEAAYAAHTVTISDVSVVEVLEEGEEPAKQYKYTSGRINTQNKHPFKYGYFETRAKVPAGQGYLPAFWLMANDENLYGQWPRCGEIDCMEVMGQETNKVYGTIHYGNPHSENQGTKIISGDFANEFHKFACEWEPGKITWYVDGVKYFETRDWHSTTEGQGTLTYPAPFDQDFYIILNLAVGGSWVGYPNDSTSFDNNPFEVDYVRVYQKNSYDEEVDRPIKVVVLREPDEEGNYIVNGNFAKNEDLTDEVDWTFKTALEGEATASIASNAIKINTANKGTVDYSVQLYQANVPLEKGAKYEVAFDAVSSAPRTMNVDVKAPDYGYKSYMPTKNPEITTQKQTFTYQFEMKDESDANGRLEFNMGASSTADVSISNVSLIKIAEPSGVEEPKGILADGNYVYNGKFQEGKNYLGYWDVSTGSATSAKVTGIEDGRRLEIKMPENVATPFTLSQKDLAFKQGIKYRVSFMAQSATDTSIDVEVGGRNNRVDIAAGAAREYSFVIPSNVRFTNKNIKFTVYNPGTLYLDNVSLAEDALIKNGSFNAGLAGYEIYVDSSASASYVVDSMTEDNALDVTVNNTSDADWKIQVKQNNVKLEKGKTYVLKLDAKSNLNRNIRAIMQGGADKISASAPGGYPVYSSDNVVTLTNEYQTITDEFTMDYDTDEEAFLSICLGKLGDEPITTQHRICIDNISLEEVAGTPGAPGTPTDEERVLEIPDQSYTGKAIKPYVEVYDGDKLLVLNKDYTVKYYNNVNINKVRKTNSGMGSSFNDKLPYAVVTGKGNYSGITKVNFNIVHAVIATSMGNEANGVVLAYNDALAISNSKQSVFKSLKVAGRTLKKDADFTVVLTNDGKTCAQAMIPAKASGEFKLEVKGKGNYTGTITKKIMVAPKSNLIKNAAITLGKNIKSVTFTGRNITLQPAYYDVKAKKCYSIVDGTVSSNTVDTKNVFYVVCGGKGLVYGKDYDVVYVANRSVGKATLTIFGKGAYTGTKSITFNITGKPFNTKLVSINGISDKVYNGNDIVLDGLKVYYKVSANSLKPLRIGNDVVVSYSNNKNKGTAKVTFTGKESSGYTGSFTKTFRIKAASIKNEVYTGANIQIPYKKGGTVLSDEVIRTSVISRNNLVLGRDYKIVYKNNNAVAAKTDRKAPVATIKGINNYAGSVDVKFTITAKSLANVSGSVAEVVYNPKKANSYQYNPSIKVLDGGKALGKNIDYTISYKSTSQEAIKAYLSANGIVSANAMPRVEIKAKGKNYSGTKVFPIHVYRNKLTTSNTKIVVASATYTGTQVTPEFKVYYAPTAAIMNKGKNISSESELIKLGFRKLAASDYNYSYGRNISFGNKAGSVSVYGKGINYGGQVTCKFKIAPKSVN